MQAMVHTPVSPNISDCDFSPSASNVTDTSITQYLRLLIQSKCKQWYIHQYHPISQTVTLVQVQAMFQTPASSSISDCKFSPIPSNVTDTTITQYLRRYYSPSTSNVTDTSITQYLGLLIQSNFKQCYRHQCHPISQTVTPVQVLAILQTPVSPSLSDCIFSPRATYLRL